MEKEKIIKTVKLILKIAVSALAVYIVTRNIDLDALWGNIRRMKVTYFILAILGFMVSKAIGAVRLNRFYRVKDLYISDKSNLRLYWLGMFYNLFLPGGIGGDGYKVYFLKKNYQQDLKSLISASVLDRVSGLVAALGLTAASFAYIDFDWAYKEYSWLLIPPLYIASYFGLKMLFKSFLPVFWKTNLLSMAVQLLQVFSAVMVMKALWVPGDLANYIFVFLVSSIAYVIPITVGGLGARELVFMFGAKQLGMDIDLAVAVGLIFYLVIVLSSFSGAYFMLFPGELKVKPEELEESEG